MVMGINIYEYVYMIRLYKISMGVHIDITNIYEYITYGDKLLMRINIYEYITL